MLVIMANVRFLTLIIPHLFDLLTCSISQPLRYRFGGMVTVSLFVRLD